jgi:hypothetical protein
MVFVLRPSPKLACAAAASGALRHLKRQTRSIEAPVGLTSTGRHSHRILFRNFHGASKHMQKLTNTAWGELKAKASGHSALDSRGHIATVRVDRIERSRLAEHATQGRDARGRSTEIHMIESSCYI